jgi:hypothetical protein
MSLVSYLVPLDCNVKISFKIILFTIIIIMKIKKNGSVILCLWLTYPLLFLNLIIFIIKGISLIIIRYFCVKLD